MTNRYWARFETSGGVQIHSQETIGPYFFSNAKADGARVSVVALMELPMTAEEAHQAHICPHCGKPTADELVEVEAVLQDGQRIAVPQGNMWALYRVVHNAANGDTSLDWDGLATLTGAYHTLRRPK